MQRAGAKGDSKALSLSARTAMRQRIWPPPRSRPLIAMHVRSLPPMGALWVRFAQSEETRTACKAANARIAFSRHHVDQLVSVRPSNRWRHAGSPVSYQTTMVAPCVPERSCSHEPNNKCSAWNTSTARGRRMHLLSNARETDQARQAVDSLHLVYESRRQHSRPPVTEQHHMDG